MFIPNKFTDSTSGTASVSALAAMANPADTPADADALRDDLVANALPAIRNNFASINVTLNALLDAVRELATRGSN